jgi:hypothetical protein
MDSREMTCTRCGGHQFVSYCKRCDPSIEEIKATARADALREAAERIRGLAPPLDFDDEERVIDALEAER